MLRILLSVLTLASFAGAAARAEEQVVILTQPAKLWVGEQVVENIPRGSAVQVLKSQRGWLWVKHEEQGWLDGQKVVPLAKAEAHFDAVLAQRPDDAIARNTRANLRMGRDAFAEAIDDYTEVIRLQPDVGRIYNNRGSAWSKKGDWRRALADFDRAIELDPDDSLAFYNRGRVRYQQKDMDGAIADYSAAIRQEPDHPWTFNNRGLAWYAKGEYAKAVADYDEALRLDPSLYLVRNNRGWARFRNGDRNEAFTDFNEVVRFQLHEQESSAGRVASAPEVRVGALPTHALAEAPDADARILAFNLPVPGWGPTASSAKKSANSSAPGGAQSSPASGDAKAAPAAAPRASSDALTVAEGEPEEAWEQSRPNPERRPIVNPDDGQVRVKLPWGDGDEPLVLSGIYQMTRNTLTLYGLTKTKRRPLAFDAYLGDHGVLVVLTRFSGGEKYDPKKSDAENIQGGWKVVAAQRNGQPTVRLNDNQLLFDAQTAKLITTDQRTYEFRYKLDLTKEPRQYDLSVAFVSGPPQDQRTKRLETMAREQYGFPDFEPQPVSFQTTLGNGRFLILSASLLALLVLFGSALNRILFPSENALTQSKNLLGSVTGAPQRSHLILAALFLCGLGLCAPLATMHYAPQPFGRALSMFTQLSFAKSSFGSPSNWVGDLLMAIPVAFLWTGVFALDRPRLTQIFWAVKIVVAGAALRVLFEFFQFWLSAQNVSQYDILPETFGIALGAVLWLAAGPTLVDWLRSLTISQRPMNKLDWVLLAYLVGFLIWSILPVEITVRGADLARKHRAGILVLVPFSEPRWMLGFVVNMLFFVPLGLLSATLWTTAVKPVRMLATSIVWGLTLVCVVELGQLLVVDRFTSITDLISGGVGVTLGAWAAQRWLERRDVLETMTPASGEYLRRVAPYLIVATIYAAIVFVASVVPFRPIQDSNLLAARYTAIFTQPFAVLDSLNTGQALMQVLWHVALFAPLGALFAWAIYGPTVPAPVRNMLLIAALGLVAALALAIEIVQVYLPGHVPGMFDVVASAIGAAVGMLAASRIKQLRAGSLQLNESF